jgi:hypothetical protein
MAPKSSSVQNDKKDYGHNNKKDYRDGYAEYSPGTKIDKQPVPDMDRASAADYMS